LKVGIQVAKEAEVEVEMEMKGAKEAILQPKRL
jgi:hypothetical protein